MEFNSGFKYRTFYAQCPCQPEVIDSFYCWFALLPSQHFEHWPKGVPICVHAEGRTTAAVILLASLNNRSVHVCHVATRDEIEIVKAAKKKV